MLTPRPQAPPGRPQGNLLPLASLTPVLSARTPPHPTPARIRNLSSPHHRPPMPQSSPGHRQCGLWKGKARKKPCSLCFPLKRERQNQKQMMRHGTGGRASMANIVLPQSAEGLRHTSPMLLDWTESIHTTMHLLVCILTCLCKTRILTAVLPCSATSHATSPPSALP